MKYSSRFLKFTMKNPDFRLSFSKKCSPKFSKTTVSDKKYVNVSISFKFLINLSTRLKTSKFKFIF